MYWVIMGAYSRSTSLFFYYLIRQADCIVNINESDIVRQSDT